MRIRDVFEIKVEEKINPVIKVSERQNEEKLASEIGSYVVTPLIEKYLDDFLEHYTDTLLRHTTEIGVWISGYFGSGKSHLAKIMALLTENPKLCGSSACDRFMVRIPHDSLNKGSIERSLSRMGQCDAKVFAFNLNTLADSKTRPLPSLLLSQYYLSKGYSGNLIYAKVIEAELDRQGKLELLHQAVEAKAKKPWKDIKENLSFFRTHLYKAACGVAPEVFETTRDVEIALNEAEKGELYNIEFLVGTILNDIKRLEKQIKKPQRIVFVLDESGQWIENDAGRLGQLQALVEEAAEKGQGKIWIILTTHGDMGSIYKEARALDGDMKKIEARFRFKFPLTTENIELVLEDRLFKKNIRGKTVLETIYKKRGGTLRGLAQLSNTSQKLPECTEDKFPTYYPFLPYQVHLIPEIVKTLRSKGGRGEQLSGSTRTLLAIAQDILRAGRRNYLDDDTGALVSFDEIYGNLAGEGEVSPDVRTELSRLKDVVPGVSSLTPRVAEVLYLIHEIAFIPRTRDNIARLLVESVDEDLPTVLARIEPELEKLKKAKLAAKIGEEYEFLTGEKRTFEQEVDAIEAEIRQQDRERGLIENFVQSGGKSLWRKWLDFETISYMGFEFPFRLYVDDNPIPGKQGDVTLKFVTPLYAQVNVKIDDMENQSLRSDEQKTIFFLSGSIKGFDMELTRYMAVKQVIDSWKGDPHRSEESRKLSRDRESNELPKIERRVLEALREGIRKGWVIFRGSSHSVILKQGQKPGEALRAEIANYWPTLYPKFDRLPVRIANDQRAVKEALDGTPNPRKDILQLKLYNKAGKLNTNCPLLDAIRMHLSTQQNQGRRVLGKEISDVFIAAPYGWDPNAIRVGVAALVRSGAVKILINKKPFTNPADQEVIDALRISRKFDCTELVLEISEIDPDILTEVRSFLMNLAQRRSIDETPASLSEVAESLANEILDKANTVSVWANGSGMPLPSSFKNGVDVWNQVKALTNPVHRVREIHGNRIPLEKGYKSINRHADFQKRNGTMFIAFEHFVKELLPVEHKLTPGTTPVKLIDAYRTTVDNAEFANDETWKQLQSLKAQAALEIQGLIESWREEAASQINKALEALPDEIEKRGLNESLFKEFSAQLHEFLNSITSVTIPARAASLPDQARDMLSKLNDRIAEEKARLDSKKGKVQPRSVKRLSFGVVTTMTRVTNEEEWEALKEKMDEQVRDLLKQGFDVELI
ncbi:MAG: BREX system P-loop protein BrxC [Candidatus Aminicenantes bacterium]|nr:BREX system P-loop protein BrxC [Candidatus Aminicenantes bacterium]NIM80586.1 BREX system P-loop protein BrxC [Candidatus Aminicenantes bacterium]NIN19967.1 BREX system P-loop protein BrxC [Candidatus Aminicenantes bacterium]NIN42595.1 BREX system P-loop protein BrxC [Candidatus Aminicenantes bacterium]NIN86593.1 BREX system P-loop protein BrxC [Candidatus Aminicenantes bacterium]